MTAYKSIFIKSVACDTLYRNYYRSSNAIAIILLVSMVFIANFNIVLMSACFLNLIILGFRRQFQNSHDPFVLIFLTFSLLFVEFPIAVMAMRYPAYFPTNGLSFDLLAPSESTIVSAIGLLFVFYLGFFAAVAFTPIKFIDTIALPRSRDIQKILVIAIVLLVFSFAYDNYFSVATTFKLPGAWIELTKFLAYDLAIFLILFLVINRFDGNLVTQLNAWLTTYYLAFGILFLVLHTFNGSKGAILLLFYIAFIFPLAILGQQPRQCLLVPRLWLITVSIFVSPLIFIVAIAFRLIRMNSRSDNEALSFFNALTKAVSNDDFLSNNGSLLFETISDRLSVVFNRYILIYQNFNTLGFSESVLALPGYIVRSFLNLHLPGTPFLDEYYPSSMQLESILQDGSYRVGDAVNLQESLNSQPFSIFGLALLFAGFFGPFLFFVLVIALRWLCVRCGFWFALFSLMFFNAILSCYGIEVAFQVSLSIIATFYFVTTLARMLARLHVTPTASHQ